MTYGKPKLRIFYFFNILWNGWHTGVNGIGNALERNMKSERLSKDLPPKINNIFSQKWTIKYFDFLSLDPKSLALGTTVFPKYGCFLENFVGFKAVYFGRKFWRKKRPKGGREGVFSNPKKSLQIYAR